MKEIFYRLFVFSICISSYNLLAVEVVDSSEYLDLSNTQDVEVVADIEPNNTETKTAENNQLQQSFESKKFNIKNLSIPARITRLENILDSNNINNQETAIQDLRSEIQRLTGILEEQEHKFNEYKRQQEIASKDLTRRLDNIITVVKNKDNNMALNLDNNNSSSTEKDLYTQGYDFLKAKQYDKAIFQFQKYLNNYPNGKYADNAYYWLGEVYLLQSNLPGAMDAFNTILQKYPKSEKAREAMLKKGIVYIYQQNFDDAKKTFNNIRKQYPNTVVARLAESRLQQIQEQLE